MAFEDEYDEYGFHPKSLISRWLAADFLWWEPLLWIVLIVPLSFVLVARWRALYFRRQERKNG
jgi:hypothetical protein